MKVDAVSFAAISPANSSQSDAPVADDFSAIFNAAGSAVAGPQTPQEELAAYLKKSIGERIRDAILKELGLTEADLAAMPPEKRIAMEETIAERVKEKLLHDKHGALTTGQALLAMVAFATDLQKAMIDKAADSRASGAGTI